VDEAQRSALSARARELQRELASSGVEIVAMTWVDNSGITRTKAVPLDRLESAAAWGVGASPVFDSFLFNDVPVTGRHAGGAVGDLRVHPDLDRVTVLAAQPGWAWAPADRYDQEGRRHPQDQRGTARAAVALLAGHGYTARMAFEVEWVVSPLPVPGSEDAFSPAVRGPAYGYARLARKSGYLRELVAALTAQCVPVEQLHPEYAQGQFELSVAAADPVGAADLCVLVRETIRAVTERHGMRASFSPTVVADEVGNGGHVHLSLWRGDSNLFAGGTGPFGLTTVAESFTGGILGRLPALLAVGAPSVVSYLRLIPQHWAGAFAAWGLENRETALRLVTGPAGSRCLAANLEVKCFDQTANPYLVVAALLFAGVAGLAEDATLPEPVGVDPATLPEADRRRRGIGMLPTSLAESATAFAAERALTEGFGEQLATTLVDIRRGEIAHFEGRTPEEIVAAMRWVH
jgi:glutamine synthetase